MLHHGMIVCYPLLSSLISKNPCLLGSRIEIPDQADFLLEATLKVVIGDLQGLPEIYFTRSPSADDVRFNLFSLSFFLLFIFFFFFFSFFYFPHLQGMRVL